MREGMGLTIISGVFTQIYSKLCDFTAWLGGFLVAALCWLLDPDIAFYGLWIMVALDFISRQVAEKVNRRPTKSSDMRQGIVKIMAYLSVCVMVSVLKKVTGLTEPALVIYCIFIFWEMKSISENWAEAGVTGFSWLAKFSKKKLEQICEDGGECLGQELGTANKGTTSTTATKD